MKRARWRHRHECRRVRRRWLTTALVVGAVSNGTPVPGRFRLSFRRDRSMENRRWRISRPVRGGGAAARHVYHRRRGKRQRTQSRHDVGERAGGSRVCGAATPELRRAHSTEDTRGIAPTELGRRRRAETLPRQELRRDPHVSDPHTGSGDGWQCRHQTRQNKTSSGQDTQASNRARNRGRMVVFALPPSRVDAEVAVLAAL